MSIKVQRRLSWGLAISPQYRDPYSQCAVTVVRTSLAYCILRLVAPLHSLLAAEQRVPKLANMSHLRSAKKTTPLDRPQAYRVQDLYAFARKTNQLYRQAPVLPFSRTASQENQSRTRSFLNPRLRRRSHALHRHVKAQGYAGSHPALQSLRSSSLSRERVLGSTALSWLVRIPGTQRAGRR